MRIMYRPYLPVISDTIQNKKTMNRKRTLKLTERMLTNIISEGLLDAMEPDPKQIGLTIAEVACNTLFDRDENFAHCVEKIAEAYQESDQKRLQSIANGFLQGVNGWYNRNAAR